MQQASSPASLRLTVSCVSLSLASRSLSRVYASKSPVLMSLFCCVVQSLPLTRQTLASTHACVLSSSRTLSLLLFITHTLNRRERVKRKYLESHGCVEGQKHCDMFQIQLLTYMARIRRCPDIAMCVCVCTCVFHSYVHVGIRCSIVSYDGMDVLNASYKYACGQHAEQTKPLLLVYSKLFGRHKGFL